MNDKLGKYEDVHNIYLHYESGDNNSLEFYEWHKVLSRAPVVKEKVIHSELLRALYEKEKTS